MTTLRPCKSISRRYTITENSLDLYPDVLTRTLTESLVFFYNSSEKTQNISPRKCTQCIKVHSSPRCEMAPGGTGLCDVSGELVLSTLTRPPGTGEAEANYTADGGGEDGAQRGGRAPAHAAGLHGHHQGPPGPLRHSRR